MSKLQVPFETVPVTSPSGETIGYAMHICPQQILEDDAVYEEVIKEETLPLSVKLLKFCVNAVLAATAKKVSQDCRPRRVGDEIKFAPFIRGRVSSPYSPFDAATGRTAVLPMTMKGVPKKIDLSRVLLVNTKSGMRVVIDRIVYEGCVKSEEIATIMRGKGIAVTGLNLQWLEGDSCTVVWKDAEGAEHSASIEPVSSTVTEMHFAWPEALADVPAGSKIEMRFRTRGGIADGEVQPNDKTVTLIEGEILPTVTKVATTGKDGIVKGQAFEATGANLGFNFATDHVSVKWTDSDGTPRQAAIVPLSATAEKIAFSTCPLFDDLPDDTELTFAFEIGGRTAEAGTRLLANPEPVIEKVTDFDHAESETDHVEANATQIDVTGRRFNLHDGTHGCASVYGHKPTGDAWECIDSHIDGVTGGDGCLSITFRDEVLATGYDRLRVVVSNDDGSDTREVPIL